MIDRIKAFGNLGWVQDFPLEVCTREIETGSSTRIDIYLHMYIYACICACLSSLRPELAVITKSDHVVQAFRRLPRGIQTEEYNIKLRGTLLAPSTS